MSGLVLDIEAPGADVPQVARVLTDSDIAALEGNLGITAPPVKKLGERHHALARLLASGMKPIECSAMLNYSLSRISILKSDPSFKQLLAHYADQQVEVMADAFKELGGLALDSIAEMRDRLMEEPEKVSNRDLISVIKHTADRSGHGPVKTQQNLNLNLSARMKAAKARAIPLHTDD